MVVTAVYSPVSAGTFSRDHYEIVTVGGNKVGKKLVLPNNSPETLSLERIFVPHSTNKMCMYLSIYVAHMIEVFSFQVTGSKRLVFLLRLTE